MKRTFILFWVFGLIVGLTGCTDNTPTSNVEAPKITAFTATPSTVTIGESVTLGWTISGTATSLSIDNGVGDVTGKTSVVVLPAANTTYTLTAVNASGSATKAVAVTVNNPGDPGSPPPPLNLHATPGSPGVINLDWGVSSGAATYEVERRGSGQFLRIGIRIVTSYSDVGLFPGTSLTYRVRALSATGARSGWSNYATAVVPGTAPIVSKIDLIPTAPRTLKPADTLQFRAVAYDASNNNLNLAQGIFTWNSSNVTVVAINDTGLATAGSLLGSSTITAAVGGKTSNAVNVSVALQENTTLVIFQPLKNNDKGFAPYRSALAAAGVSYDEIIDGYENAPPTFTFDQIKKYERIFYFSHADSWVNGQTLALMKEYLDQGNRRVSMLGESTLLNNDQGFRTYIGLENDGYTNTSKTILTYTGQPGSAMAGFSFDRAAVSTFVSKLKLKSGGDAIAAIKTMSTDATPVEVIIAMQVDVGDNSKFFYGGLLLENIPTNKQSEFISRLIGGM
jgi:hypothetical protein